MIVEGQVIGEIGYLHGLCQKCGLRVALHNLDGRQTIPMMWDVHDCPTPEQVKKRLPNVDVWWNEEFFQNLRKKYPGTYAKADEWNHRRGGERPWLNAVSPPAPEPPDPGRPDKGLQKMATGVQNLSTDSESTALAGSESHGLEVSRSAKPQRRQPESTLEIRTKELTRKPSKELLNRLVMEHGMSWFGIAQAIEVSVQSIRKWRFGGFVSTENRIALAKIVATLDILEKQIEDPAGWLEMPVLEGYSLRHLDLLAQKGHQLLLDLAVKFITPGDLLKNINPNWETEMYLEHEVFTAEDGLPAIRRRNPHGQP